MQRDQFRRLVQRAMRSLPPGVTARLDNVAIEIRREPSADDLKAAGVADGHDLFGLYVGTPQTERSHYDLLLPDRILIFQGPLERHYRPAEIPTEVARTVLHELAHHFGITDERLSEIGMD